MVSWIIENISQPDPSADDPRMAQLEELSSEGCQAEHVWVETGLKSAGNSAFSRRERSFWGAFLWDLKMKGEYWHQFSAHFLIFS